MNYNRQDTKQTFFLVTYTHIYIHIYIHTDRTKCLTLLRIRAQGNYYLEIHIQVQLHVILPSMDKGLVPYCMIMWHVMEMRIYYRSAVIPTYITVATMKMLESAAKG